MDQQQRSGCPAGAPQKVGQLPDSEELYGNMQI